MTTYDEIEFCIIQMKYPPASFESQMRVICHTADAIVTYKTPRMIFRMKIMESKKMSRRFFELLLELNVTSMIHRAYGVEENNVALIDTRQCEHFDFNEFHATLDASTLVGTQDYEKLKVFRD
jgi:hypothetical protein